MIQDENPRMKWKLGMIEKLVNGKDDFVISAKLRTRCGTRLFPFEINEKTILVQVVRICGSISI